MPTPRVSLRQALGLGDTPYVALVGAGGKSRGLFTLAEAYPPPVLLSTTTHLALEQADWAEEHWPLEDPTPAALQRLLEKPLPPRRILITGPREGERWTGPSPAQWEVLRAFWETQPLPLLVEADGAARKPLKAPAEHEPNLPPGVRQVVAVAGLEALGQPLGERVVHRPERFAALTGLALGEAITPQAVARALAHPQGGRKRLPQGASWCALLVGRTPEQLAASIRVAQALWEQGIRAPVAVARGRETRLATMAAHVPTAGIVLAAGPSRRMPGVNKLLLPVQGEPMVHRVARTALEALLDPVVVVVGHDAEAVARAVADLPVQVVHNPHWEAGQSTSVRAGLQALPPGTGAAVFLLGDMPFVPPTLVRALVAAHAQTLAPIVAPRVEHRRGNPVLFDAVTFPDLLALHGDVGGRVLFDKYPVHTFPWFDETTQRDVDTAADAALLF